MMGWWRYVRMSLTSQVTHAHTHTHAEAWICARLDYDPEQKAKLSADCDARYPCQGSVVDCPKDLSHCPWGFVRDESSDGLLCKANIFIYQGVSGVRDCLLSDSWNLV
eukprot:Blabericola_migrator_1__578@NODE_1142_length_5300_cov_104_746990_g777_i0_p5_GENE_NODE_1142_length_5300_cov_104_746990_g777_i0NODE_1142_length_5300_cov_104_746990_g777_i0_p5_ORF_typecomplete_len108_score8_99CPW_WPC/PF09717_10/0_32CPW_WPC/PF09717_10/33Antistasin/PF02822_14/0_058Tme5_EGF_like/PF09064_10/11_NODE_1142_length_5300_cov_104_746990_g777_i019852308